MLASILQRGYLRYPSEMQPSAVFMLLHWDSVSFRLQRGGLIPSWR